MNSHYHIVREISGCWIQKPNGSELYDDPHEIVEELNRLQRERDEARHLALMMLGMYRMKSDEQKQRIKRLEEVGDEVVINYVNSLSAFEMWRKAKEAKP